jgi:beta-lactamase superfamily II metal-dependent hydrolase
MDQGNTTDGVEPVSRRVLFTGDIEAKGSALIVTSADLRAAILKVPHHGSKTSSFRAAGGGIRGVA